MLVYEGSGEGARIKDFRLPSFSREETRAIKFLLRGSHNISVEPVT
jgi:hypothetical protein